MWHDETLSQVGQSFVGGQVEPAGVEVRLVCSARARNTRGECACAPRAGAVSGSGGSGRRAAALRDASPVPAGAPTTGGLQ